MPTHTRPRRRPLLLRRTFATMLAAAALGVTGVTATGATFTDTVAPGANAIATGNVAITADSNYNYVAPQLAPGETVVRGVPVTNTGNLTLRYAITQIGDAAGTNFHSRLRTEVKVGASLTAANCTNDTNWASNGGTLAYGPAAPSTTAQNLVGNPATGNQAGDRTLAPGATETICFRWSLPSGQTGNYGGAGGRLDVTFVAEQTQNNP